MPLTDVAVRAAKPREKSYKLADGQGMYLEVMPNGSKYWRLKYRIDGKEKRMAIGVYPAVTLLAARKARDEIKDQLRGGLDPSHEKKRVAMPAFAGIPADNIAWSARSVQTAAPSAACTAYSGRPIESGLPLNMDTVLKSVGKALLGSALSVTQGYQGTVPNPCARAGL